MSALDEFVGMRIRHCRWKAGLRQEDIAIRLGISLQQVRRYETGESRISASRLFDLACLFDVPITHFFAGIPPGNGDGGEPGGPDRGGRDPDGTPHIKGAPDLPPDRHSDIPSDRPRDDAAEVTGSLPPDPRRDAAAKACGSDDAASVIGPARGAGRLSMPHTGLDRATLQKRLCQYVDCLPQQEQEAIMAMLQAMAERRGCRADLP